MFLFMVYNIKPLDLLTLECTEQNLFLKLHELAKTSLGKLTDFS